MVEQGTENPRVGSSILSLGTIKISQGLQLTSCNPFFFSFFLKFLKIGFRLLKTSAPQQMGSLLGSSMKKIQIRHAPRLPSYLYKKGGVFYYRFRLSKKLSEFFGNSEIRVSFRTGFKKEAIAMAKKVHEHISAKLEAGDFADPGLSNEERLFRLREEAKKFVDDVG